MNTAQMYSPVMPSPQPLLSAPYQPAPSPAIRPVHGKYFVKKEIYFNSNHFFS
jgi:hypothetical protein